MTDVAIERCFNHQQREAAARCPECRRFFCRECVTEHDDRVICASCLKALAAAQQARKTGPRYLAATINMIAGFFILWLMFYWLGCALMLLPTAFHKGALWRDTPLEDFFHEND